MRRLWKSSVLGIFILFFVLFWIFVIGISSDQDGSYYNNAHNAVWLGHKWVGEESSEAEVLELVKRLSENEIDTVFVHCGPLKSDGTIDPETYGWAMDFLEKARKFEGDIKYQAWLGQIRSSLDLGDPYVRENIVKQVSVLVNMVEFDGIHFDVEPVWDGDMDFIKLLEESDAVLLEGKKMSVALAEFIPGSVLWMLGHFHEFKNYNTEVNYRNVAEYADQIVVMVYDTGTEREWVYRWLVKEQTIRVTSLFDDKEVFIGIPSYENESEHFYPDVENVKNGLEGIVNGLNNIRSDEDNFAGVAIYSYWETEEDEWEDYRKLWIEEI